MPVPEIPDNDVCAICRAEITQDAEDPDERPQFLARGHSFHAICIKAYVGSAGTTIEDIECPNCTLTASDMKDREDSLMADAPGPYDGDPLWMPIDAQDAEDAESWMTEYIEYFNQRAYLWKLDNIVCEHGKVTETWSWKPE